MFLPLLPVSSRFSDLLTGKGLVIGGSHSINPMNEEVQYGDLSAVLMQNTPFWGHWLRTPELSIALMDEWENKIEKLAQSTINENVTSVSGVPTWTIVLFKRILEITGKKTLKEVWPYLELYHSWRCFVYALSGTITKAYRAKRLIIWKCIMQVKVFLLHRIFPVKMECCCLRIMAFLWNSCR